jgi:uncharacterized protein YndB with AHSA1/START domain
MSTKTKASSKNKKATAKKAVKKASPPKAKKAVAKKIVKASKPAEVKKTTKSIVAKKAVKKNTVKKVAAKKAVAKKIVKKPVVKAVAKKASPKKVAKKAAPKKAIKKAVTKSPAKKAVVSKISKAAKPVKTAKSVAVKKAVTKTPAAKVEKPVVMKAVKSEKAPAVKPDKPAAKEKVVVKKSIVAPITFRQEDPVQAKFIKEPNGKFEMEFVIRASEDMVFEFVSTESGLSEWFCDDVTIRNGIFTFTWDGQQQQAKLVKEIPPMYIRYQWMDKNDGSYFEFKTQKDELTNDISLIITDFASDKSDEESARLLWHSQVDKLLHVLGSFF